MLANALQRIWFSQRRLSPALCLLWLLFWPLHLLFIAVSGWRRRQVRAERLPVPVVVVGNLLVGGAGKTPLTLFLARQLQAAGRRPGIVSRGYGRQGDAVQAVRPDSPVAEVGDEPLLLARRAGVPVWVGRDRVAAARALLAAHPEVDVLLCDDGLQHYRLGRDVEIAVFDSRGVGNGWRLPLGPLREPLSRLAGVDAVVCNGPRLSGLPATLPVFDMRLQPGDFVHLTQPERRARAADLAGRPLQALAGIGHPERFFTTLEGLGLHFGRHAFPDHHRYTADDLDALGEGVLLMTEKDAVKCTGLTPAEAWYLPVEAELPPALVTLILEKIIGRQAA